MSDNILDFLNKRMDDLKLSLSDSNNLSQTESDFFEGQADELKTIYQYYTNHRPLETSEEWSNYAAFGYVIDAAKNIDLSDEIIRNLISAMFSSFDRRTIDEAEDIYRSSPY